MARRDETNALHGLLAEFESPEQLLSACEAVRAAGYRRFDAHTPMPIHGLDRAMGLPASRLPWIVLACALTGTASGFLLQWWVSVVEYPLIISGKPFWSWPAFVPIAFELTILGGALGAVLGMFFLNRLPRWHHPLFESERFERASDDGFFLSVEASDPAFDLEKTRALLEARGARAVERVEIPEEASA